MPYNPAELHDLIILIAYCRIYAQDDDDRSASFDKCFIIKSGKDIDAKRLDLALPSVDVDTHHSPDRGGVHIRLCRLQADVNIPISSAAATASVFTYNRIYVGQLQNQISIVRFVASIDREFCTVWDSSVATCGFVNNLILAKIAREVFMPDFSTGFLNAGGIFCTTSPRTK
jgi:hypothetical protein